MTGQTCAVETGLLRKKPCGNAAVAACLNCEQPLCSEHALPETNQNGKKTGKFLCKECLAAAKEHEKSLASVARAEEQKKKAAVEKALMESIMNPAASAKKPATPPGAAPVAPAAKPGEAKKEEEKKKDDTGALEFTPKDGNLSYTPMKKDEQK